MFTARSRRHAFMIVAFSRSSRPIRPISWERLIIVPGSSADTISAACCSSSLFTGEKTDETATDRMPRSPISAAKRCNSFGSSGEIWRPSNSCPPCPRNQWFPSASRSRSGQSTIGGSACVAGRPSRMQAVGIRRFASTTAFVKCVVPIITA